MSFLENTHCYAAPGYGGHVPALKHEIAATYGNATRGLLKSDASLLKAAKRHGGKGGEVEDGEKDPIAKVWGGNEKGRVDDRFSFPPVAGYTGYIPRSSKQFGKTYINSTAAALSEFYQTNPPHPTAYSAISTSSQYSTHRLNPRVRATLDDHHRLLASTTHNPKKVISPGSSYVSPYHHHNHRHQTGNGNGNGPTQSDGDLKTPLAGYTGFIPTMHYHVGVAFDQSVRNALSSVKQERSERDAKERVWMEQGGGHGTIYEGVLSGHGKANGEGLNGNGTKNEVNGGSGGKKGKHLDLGKLEKDITKQLPIAGYKGHITGYTFRGDKSFSTVSKQCIQEYAVRKAVDQGNKGHKNAHAKGWFI